MDLIVTHITGMHILSLSLVSFLLTVFFILFKALMINEQDYFKTRINRKSENECMDECTDECIEKRGGKDG